MQIIINVTEENVGQRGLNEGHQYHPAKAFKRLGEKTRKLLLLPAFLLCLLLPGAIVFAQDNPLSVWNKRAQIKRFSYPNWLSVKKFFRSLSASMLALIIPLILAACNNQAQTSPNGSHPENQMNSSAEPPLIDPEVVRKEIEKHKDYKKLLKTSCPKRIIDRHEEMRRYPAIDILHSLKYATVTDDSSRNMYEKVIELTFEGRRELANYTKEESDRYVITLARREYITGSGKIDKIPKSVDRAFVHFRWRWKAFNRLGEILSVPSIDRNSDELTGNAIFQRTAEGWKLVKLSLEDDHKDYLHAA